jgi:hypothetical protein
MERLRKTKEESQDSRCSHRESNRTLVKSKSAVLPLHLFFYDSDVKFAYDADAWGRSRSVVSEG